MVNYRRNVLKVNSKDNSSKFLKPEYCRVKGFREGSNNGSEMRKSDLCVYLKFNERILWYKLNKCKKRRIKKMIKSGLIDAKLIQYKQI